MHRWWRKTPAGLIALIAVSTVVSSASACTYPAGTPMGGDRLGTTEYAFAGTVTSAVPADALGGVSRGGVYFTMEVDRYLAVIGPSTVQLYTPSESVCGLDRGKVVVGQRLALVHNGPLTGVVEVGLLDDFPETLLDRPTTPYDFRPLSYKVTFADPGRRTVRVEFGFGACETVRLDKVKQRRRAVSIGFSTATDVPRGSMCTMQLNIRCATVVLERPLGKRALVNASSGNTIRQRWKRHDRRGCPRVSPGEFVRGT
jgi:hypothetical protein